MDQNRFSEEDFSSFLSELISGNNLDGQKENGIAQLAIDRGYEKLSKKQQYVLELAISHYYIEECKRCFNEIPWCEMYDANFNKGYCSYCRKMVENDD